MHKLCVYGSWLLPALHDSACDSIFSCLRVATREAFAHSPISMCCLIMMIILTVIMIMVVITIMMK